MSQKFDGMNFENAVRYCELRAPAWSWRLPTREELTLLYNSKDAGIIRNSAASYWSSTTAGEGAAWYVLFGSGSSGGTSNTGSIYAPARVVCVRR
jgi:hypothetical protein